MRYFFLVSVSALLTVGCATTAIPKNQTFLHIDLVQNFGTANETQVSIVVDPTISWNHDAPAHRSHYEINGHRLDATVSSFLNSQIDWNGKASDKVEIRGDLDLIGSFFTQVLVPQSPPEIKTRSDISLSEFLAGKPVELVGPRPVEEEWGIRLRLSSTNDAKKYSSFVTYKKVLPAKLVISDFLSDPPVEPLLNDQRFGANSLKRFDTYSLSLCRVAKAPIEGFAPGSMVSVSGPDWVDLKN